MKTYQFRRLQNPSEDELNDLGLEGYHIVGTVTDPRDGELIEVLMEREIEVMITAGGVAHPANGANAIKPKSNGRR